MKLLKFLCLSLLISACGNTRAVYDYDEKADFSSYDSYAIFPDSHTGLNQLDEKRLMNSVEKEMLEKNFTSSPNPDVFLNIYSEEYQEQSRNSLGVGIGGTGGNMGVGVSGGIPIGGPETFLRLTFDLIDVSTDALIWQAVVDSKFDFSASPEERQKRFDSIVSEALKGYPPKR